MKAVLLRIGIDTGCGGIHRPLFKDGSFEYVPIPNMTNGEGIDEHTIQSQRGVKYRTLPSERAWIPAFAGMTRSGNRQSINRIGIILYARGPENNRKKSGRAKF